MSKEKRYVLIQDYYTPTKVIRAGVVKTIAQWVLIFPDMWGDYFDSKKDWFEEIKDEKPFQWSDALVWDAIRQHEKSHTKNIQHTIDQFKASKVDWERNLSGGNPSKHSGIKETIAINIDPDKMYFINYPMIDGRSRTNIDGMEILNRLVFNKKQNP